MVAVVIYLDLLFLLMRFSGRDTCGIILYLLLVRLGFRTASFFSLITGEITLSVILGYGIIIPSPLGIEVVASPARMITNALTKTDWQLKNF